MNKEFVPYELAVKLKALGFDEDCFGYRDGTGHLMIKKMTNCVISAPTFSQAFRWFRKEHKLHSHCECVNSTREDNFKYDIHFQNDTIKNKTGFDTFEDAELECLKKLIEIVEQKIKD